MALPGVKTSAGFWTAAQAEKKNRDKQARVLNTYIVLATPVSDDWPQQQQWPNVWLAVAAAGMMNRLPGVTGQGDRGGKLQ
jgi:hypothetical protein